MRFPISHWNNPKPPFPIPSQPLPPSPLPFPRYPTSPTVLDPISHNLQYPLPCPLAHHKLPFIIKKLTTFHENPQGVSQPIPLQLLPGLARQQNPATQQHQHLRAVLLKGPQFLLLQGHPSQGPRGLLSQAEEDGPGGR